MLTIRRSADRGLAEHGWLKSRHTFSFAEYLDPQHMGFGPLRVINEDWIQAGMGFGAHPHRDMEIITYIVSGSLRHRDSLGNQTVIYPDEIQRMTAGSGIVHSEMNLDSQETHLLQIWIKPEQRHLTPGYGQKSFAEALRSGQPVLVISKDGREGSVSINQDVDLYITRLDKSSGVEFPLSSGRSAWVQTIAGNISIQDRQLNAGDAAAITDESLVNIVGEQGAEFMVFII